MPSSAQWEAQKFSFVSRRHFGLPPGRQSEILHVPAAREHVLQILNFNQKEAEKLFSKHCLSVCHAVMMQILFADIFQAGLAANFISRVVVFFPSRARKEITESLIRISRRVLFCFSG